MHVLTVTNSPFVGEISAPVTVAWHAVALSKHCEYVSTVRERSLILMTLDAKQPPSISPPNEEAMYATHQAKEMD